MTKVVNVFCIEGVHGVGKTTVASTLKKKGFCVMDENFMEYNNTKLHPQHFVLESRWAMCMFYNIIKLAETETTIITDRSPYTAMIYSRKGGKMLRRTLDESIKQLSDDLNINFYVLCLYDEREKIWKRIQKRLKKEPKRKKYGEDDKEWFNKIYDIYDFTIKSFCSKRINNSNDNAISEIEKFIKSK